MSEVSTPYANGTPSWADLMTTDREAAVEFYGHVFGWDFEVGPPETGSYTMCSVRGLPVAGIGQQQPGQEAPVVWTTYLAVDDVDATVDKIKNAGGTVMMDPMDVMDQGRMAIAADPTGAVFGMWQAGQHTGAKVVNEAGAICWNEAATRDTAAAKEFYRSVFGLSLQPMPGDFDYTTLNVGDRPVAGVMAMDDNIPPEVPPYWLTYIGAADTDAAVAAVREHGGSVVTEPFDSEFGRIAIVRDPQGAVFALIQLVPEQQQTT